MKKGYVIAIDGPSGAGKSTVAYELAKRLGYRYIDTGAMYRAAALAAERERLAVSDPAALKDFLNKLVIRQEMVAGRVITLLGDEDVSGPIRRADMGMKASAISARPEVRQRLVALQRKMGKDGGVVMEGRDIGTVVFPEADYKFFLTASDRERARRRYQEHVDKGDEVEFEEVLQDIRKRDQDDSRRAVAPLRRDPKAVEIDSTRKSVETVVKEVLKLMGSAAGG